VCNFCSNVYIYFEVIAIKPTIKQVAEEAGVSIATVSRVLNGKDRVKDSTRSKIWEVIERLNFQPDQNARSMIKKESKLIGLVVPELMNEYWVQLFDVLQNAFWRKGYTLILGSTDRSPEKEKAFMKSFVERRVDGIIVGSALTEDEELTELLSHYAVPIVSLDPKKRDVACVLGDHLQGATEAVEHLIRLGHRQIAFLCGPTIPDYRELGLRNAFMMNHLPVDERLIRRVDSTVNFQLGYNEMKALLAEAAPFTAVFAYSDAVAFGAVRALEEAKLRVPEDIAVVGYDDVQMASMFKPALTTVRQPIRDIGESMAGLLIEMIESDEETRSTTPAKTISLQMELIVRDSCGAKLQQGAAAQRA